MRRQLVRGILGTLVATAALLISAGCAALPAGVDGEMNNEWPSMAEPTGWSPEAGKCTKSFAGNVRRAAYFPVACDTGHYYETVAVGEFTGDNAQLPSPPQTGSPGLSAAWSDCDKKTQELLGDDWRNGKIWIGVSVPSSGAWDGGARWYMCEAGALNRINGDHVILAASLKGEFTKESSLRLGCRVLNEKDESKNVETPCTSPHNQEFAGTFVSSLSWDEMQDYDHTSDQMHAKCRSVIARYVGVPDDGKMKYRTGTVVVYPQSSDWDAGDHSVRCYLWLSNRNLTRSLKGTGNGGLPINYA